MTYQEFIKQLIFKKDVIEIPCLNTSIEKELFLYSYGYDTEKQNFYLQQLYFDNQEKLKDE